MKKLFLMALTSLMIFATSCSKDENNSIEGSWYPESFTEKDGTKVEIDDCEKKGTLTFASGKVTNINYVYNNKNCVKVEEITATYTIAGNKITIQEAGKKTVILEFSVSGNTLTIVEEDGTTIYKRK